MAIQQFETWPERLRSADINFFIRPMVDFGPPMRNGKQQVVSSSAGHWVAQLTYDVNLADEVREFLAASAKGAGGATEWFVPARYRLLAPWPAGTDFSSTYGAVTLAGSRSFAVSRRLVRKVINIVANAAAAAGASQMNVKVLKAGTLRRGQHFTVVDATGRKRLHVVTEVPSLVSTGIYTIKFAPPLRGALAAGAALDWDSPSCTMVFADPDTAQLTLRPYYSGQPTVAFRESFNGL
jgi:hypothetical protein